MHQLISLNIVIVATELYILLYLGIHVEKPYGLYMYNKPNLAKLLPLT